MRLKRWGERGAELGRGPGFLRAALCSCRNRRFGLRHAPGVGELPVLRVACPRVALCGPPCLLPQNRCCRLRLLHGVDVSHPPFCPHRDASRGGVCQALREALCARSLSGSSLAPGPPSKEKAGAHKREGTCPRSPSRNTAAGPSQSHTVRGGCKGFEM